MISYSLLNWSLFIYLVYFLNKLFILLAMGTNIYTMQINMRNQHIGIQVKHQQRDEKDGDVGTLHTMSAQVFLPLAGVVSTGQGLVCTLSYHCIIFHHNSKCFLYLDPFIYLVCICHLLYRVVLTVFV